MRWKLLSLQHLIDTLFEEGWISLGIDSGHGGYHLWTTETFGID